MPRRNTKNTNQLNAEIDAGLLAEFRAFLKRRAERLRDHLELAIRRHLANPPPPLEPPPAPPLPPFPATAPPESPDEGKPRKGKKR